ncbi:Do family serine endopeptidase [Rhodobacteraceae bacterium 2376]|uniref:Probable periplasmic serine endoprotease DegP-like n=2 Tax=Rhabdonatronobacter sediminivivens TaxID=2743469 RepID=A0A7Z0I130_9RHOB|nr:Do family serine endopeptidase [Rhabdonatronobacter sediminivivens]NYS25991.1 Do family serine endopeptidase [Rhabdonatronobacter sediminivivens]
MTKSRAMTLSCDTRRYLWPGLAVLMLAVLLLAMQTVQAAAQDRPASFADLAESVSPSVVNITTSTTVASRNDPMPTPPQGSPFEDFFRDFFDREDRPRQSQALGSGFVISEDGFIVTNNHVIEGADEILVEFFAGLELPATLIGTDPATDLALLKVEHESPLPYVPWGDSEASRVGDWVIAVGNPLGQGFSVSAGIISARGRALQGNYDDYIQTDAAINRGNSGGPLFNMEGEVIGVNTAILSPTGGSIGIGFAMSSNVAVGVIEQLREFGTTRRGWLGVRIQDLTDDMAEALGLDRAEGAMVTDVMEGPSREAGMQTGDVILRFDGGIVRDTRQLVRRVGDAGVGRDVEVVVFRDNEELTLTVTLGQRELVENGMTPPDEAAPEPEEETAGSYMGMRLEPLTDALREEMGIASGMSGLLVRDVDPESDAAQKDVRPGDVITEAGQTPVNTVAELRERAEEAREAGRRSLLVLLRRGGDPRFVALSVEED